MQLLGIAFILYLLKLSAGNGLLSIKHAVSLESTKEAQELIEVIAEVQFTLRRRNG